MEISHALNEEGAETFKAAVLDRFPQAEITLQVMSGLCCFYAQRKGLIVGYVTK